MLRISGALFSAALAALLFGCGGNESGGDTTPAKIRVGFVTNCAVEFWAIAEAGAQDAAKANDVDVMVRMPPTGTAEEQKRALEDLVAADVKGIAVSPKDPDNMTSLLNGIGERCHLITHDSDAPKSNRLCFIGVANYEAGRMCGQLIEEAMPAGGPICILVGTLDQDNARHRRQGLIDHLLGRERDATRFDKIDAVLKNDKWEIRATATDSFDTQRAKTIVEDWLTRWSDIKGMVGLFADEPPIILDAVKSAGRLDKIRIVGFDENAGTLQGIKDGTVYGSIVQNPYEYGRQSVELLAKLAREPDEQKRKSLMPASGMLTVPARQIRKDNVDAFWTDLKSKLGR
jgi:ribose transport system substrate-binding protein